VHRGMPEEEAASRTVALLKKVGIDRPEACFTTYPHQLSGGMKQRVMIAMALSLEPKVLIADEPTTALDLIIQKEILLLLKKLQEEYGMALLLITHDCSVVAEMADDVVVMYHGQVVEYTDKENMLKNPKHPYTQGLLQSLPQREKRKQKLWVISGMAPGPQDDIAGCSFHPRCPFVMQKCRHGKVPEFVIKGHGMAKCWLHEGQAQ